MLFRSISGVMAAASDAGATAAQVLSAATDVSRRAENLEGEVGKFLAALSAAQLEGAPVICRLNE